MRSTFGLLMAVVLAACFSSDSPTEPQSASRAFAASLAGPWNEIHPINGDSLHLQFTASDTTLTAAGTFTSAHGAGQLAGEGIVRSLPALFAPSGSILPARAELSIELAYSDGRSARFDQSHFIADTLDAVLSFESTNASMSYEVKFVRASLH